MRRRLINSTLAVVLVVIAVFGVSLVIVETRTIQDGAQESVASEAVRLVGIVESRLGSGEKITPEILSEQITAHREYVAAETLVARWLETPSQGQGVYHGQVSVDGQLLQIRLRKSAT